MAFSYQQSVGLENKKAIPGDRANNQVAIYTPTNFVAGAGVEVGSFVWRDATHPETTVAGSTAGSDDALGFVERIQNVPNYNITTEGTLAVPEGENVEVATHGDFYIVADATHDVGDEVYAYVANGHPTFSTSMSLPTGFKAFTAGDSGDLTIITKR